MENVKARSSMIRSPRRISWRSHHRVDVRFAGRWTEGCNAQLGHLRMAAGDRKNAGVAMDTFLNDGVLNLTSRLETIAHEKVKERAWSYITLGIGHGEQWWRQFCYRLRINGYDGWLSIEHEDIIFAGILHAFGYGPEPVVSEVPAKIEKASPAAALPTSPRVSPNGNTTRRDTLEPKFRD
jgi:hypothetical protein